MRCCVPTWKRTSDPSRRLQPVRPGTCIAAAAAAVALGACTAGPRRSAPPAEAAAPARPVGCVDISALSPKNAPPEILPGVRQCLDAHDYARAARLFAVSDAYGRFDTLRVRDVTAHEVIPALDSAYLGSADQDSKAQLLVTVKELSASSADLLSLCRQVRALGPPTYYPTYMTLHGLLSGQQAGLKRDFNRGAAWESALQAVLQCPGR